jgi:hypothetical protein
MPRTLVLLFAFAASGLFACKSVSSEARVELASLGIDGGIGIDKSAVTSRNSVDSLGLTRDTAVPDLRADFQWDTWHSPHLTLNGFASSHGGDGVLDHDLSQGAVTIPAGTAVGSKFDVGYYSSVCTFDLSTRRDFEAGLGFGLAWLDLKADFTSKVNGDEIFTDSSKPIPLLAARLGWRGDRFAVSGLISGIGASYGGDRATFLDADLCAELMLFGKKHAPSGSVVLGWRYLHSSVQYDDTNDSVDAAISIAGPYLGFAMHF